MPIGGGSLKGTVTGVIVEDGATGTPTYAIVTSSASANTFGNWAQIDASTSADSWICGILVWTSSTSTVSVIEVGTGAPASESTIIRISCPQGQNAATVPWVYAFPIPIKVASGTRIAARAAINTAVATNYSVAIQYYQSL